MPQISSNFILRSKLPNFERDSFKTKEEMEVVPSAWIDEGHISYCEQDGQLYIFNTTGYTEAGELMANKNSKTGLDRWTKLPISPNYIVEDLRVITVNDLIELDNLMPERKDEDLDGDASTGDGEEDEQTSLSYSQVLSSVMPSTTHLTPGTIVYVEEINKYYFYPGESNLQYIQPDVANDVVGYGYFRPLIPADTVTQTILEQTLSNYVQQTVFENFQTTTQNALNDRYTKSEVDNELKSYVKTETANNYVQQTVFAEFQADTEDELNDRYKKSDTYNKTEVNKEFDLYYKKSDTYNKTEVDKEFALYVKKTDLGNDYVSQTDFGDFKTTNQDALNDRYTKSEVDDKLTTYVTQTDLLKKQYVNASDVNEQIEAGLKTVPSIEQIETYCLGIIEKECLEIDEIQTELNQDKYDGGYVTKNFLDEHLKGKEYISSEDLEGYNYIIEDSLNDQLDNYVRNETFNTELDNYAKSEDLNNYAKKEDLDNYAKTDELQKYATNDTLTNNVNDLKSLIEAAKEEGRLKAMRRIYEAYGATYNDGDEVLKIKTPWEGDADETVDHKTSCYFLNGVGDITEDEMFNIYIAGRPDPYSSQTPFKKFANLGGIDIVNEDGSIENVGIKTFIPGWLGADTELPISLEKSFYECNNLRAIKFCNNPNNDVTIICSNLKQGFYNCKKLVVIEQPINIESIESTDLIENAFEGCEELKYIDLIGLNVDLDLSSCKNLTAYSLNKIIINAKNKEINITIHKDSYESLISEALIQEALNSKTNIHLIQA